MFNTIPRLQPVLIDPLAVPGRVKHPSLLKASGSLYAVTLVPEFSYAPQVTLRRIYSLSV
jgi:hypothetical protein